MVWQTMDLQISAHLDLPGMAAPAHEFAWTDMKEDDGVFPPCQSCHYLVKCVPLFREHSHLGPMDRDNNFP